MKNITITMDEEPAEWVRIEAAKRNTSVSRMLGELVAAQMRQQDAYQMAMRDALQFKTWGVSAAPYTDRDALYDRPRFR